ncbi:5-formyltetrahydrofolate cyclo-ligase [Sphingomonas panni]
MTDKRALRAELRARRKAFVAGGPTPPAPPPLFLHALRPGAIVASYVPIGSEADPARFDAAVRAAGASLAWPVVLDRESPISFHVDDAMRDGPFGLRQPSDASPAVAPDIILTPLVGFDAAGNRLGQGRAITTGRSRAGRTRCEIGIAWSVQRVDALPCDPWDVPLHAIVTETDLFLTGVHP